MTAFARSSRKGPVTNPRVAWFSVFGSAGAVPQCSKDVHKSVRSKMRIFAVVRQTPRRCHGHCRHCRHRTRRRAPFLACAVSRRLRCPLFTNHHPLKKENGENMIGGGLILITPPHDTTSAGASDACIASQRHPSSCEPSHQVSTCRD
jgi:hypothetical protein